MLEDTKNGNNGRHGLMVVGFSAYHHQRCEFKSCSWRVVLDTTLCDKVCQ